MQLGESLDGDERDLDVVVVGERPHADDVDIGLGELAVATLLRPLPAPHFLRLVAPEREGQVAGVLQHVAGERHGEIEVQTQLVDGVVLRVQAADDVDLLLDLAFAGQLLQRLDGARLDGAETVQFEGAAKHVEHGLLHDPTGGQILGKARQGARTGHQIAPLR